MRNPAAGKIILFMFIMCLFQLPGFSTAYADDVVPQGADEGKEPEEFKPGQPFQAEGSLLMGYRFVTNEDSSKAAEYIYPHSSVNFGLQLLSAPLPYRYHLNGEYLSKYDYYMDGGFAYKDLLLFRDILTGLHHNLDHINFLYSGEPPGLVYDDRNVGDEYYVDYIGNLLSLRLKAPDFPFHLFFKHRFAERDGLVEQRYLVGDFSSLTKTSASREIEWQSDAYTFGLNSHLGPVEIEYAFDQGEFDPGNNNVLFDYYPPSSDLSRPGDVFPHNVVPETESASHSLKFHSSYTGGLVAAATFASSNQKNNYSLTESNTWKGVFDFSWIPDPVIGLFFRYRHRNVDMDTPDFVTLEGLNTSLSYPVREGVSYEKDTFSLSARYRPFTKFSLVPKYEFMYIDKENTDQWILLKDKSAVHTISLTGHYKPLENLKLKAVYEFKHYDDPAYNIDPDNSNKVRLTTTYVPVPYIYLYLDYLLAVTDRDNLLFHNNSPSVLIEDGERSGRRDQLLASLSWMVSEKTTVTTSWQFNRWDIDQDLIYGKRDASGAGDLPYIDTDVPYTDQANSFSLGLNYLPREDVTVTADVTHTLSEGEYVPGDIFGDSTSSLISYTDLEAAETIFSFGISKKFLSNWEMGLKFYTDIYDDRTDDVLDGKLFITTLSLKRYF